MGTKLVELLSRIGRIMYESVGKLSAQSKAALENGERVIKDLRLFARKEATGKSAFDLIEAQDVEALNIKNFDRNTFGAGVDAVIDRLELMYGTDLIANNPTAKSVVYQPIVDTMDVSILNAEVHIKVNGSIRAKLAVRDFTEAPVGCVNGLANGVTLREPILVKDGETFAAYITQPAAIALPALSQHYYELALRGSQIAPRN